MFFLTGAGISGLVGRIFAMRLMHLGFKVHIIGDTTTPAVKENDLVIVISGSGKSKTSEIKIAIEQKAKIAVITSNSNSDLAEIADIILVIPGRKKEEESISYKERRIWGLPIAPLGTLFELSCLVILINIISYLVIKQNKTEKDLNDKHAKPE